MTDDPDMKSWSEYSGKDNEYLKAIPNVIDAGQEQ